MEKLKSSDIFARLSHSFFTDMWPRLSSVVFLQLLVHQNPTTVSLDPDDPVFG